MFNSTQVKGKILVCVIPAMVLPSAGALLYFVFLPGRQYATIAYGLTKLFTVVWPWYATLVVIKHRGVIKPRQRLRSLPLGLLTGASIGGAVLIAYAFTPVGAYAQEFTEVVRGRLTVMGVGAPHTYIVYCMFLAVIHSLIEEVYWRWFVFSQLTRCFPAWVCYVAASLAFSGHHYVALGCYFSAKGAFIFGTFVGVGGAIWCWLLRRQGTVLGAWLSHAIVDMAIFAVGYDLLFG